MSSLFQTSSADFAWLTKRAVAEIISEREMLELLRSGRKLRLKEGFDPSAPDIHLGHMVSLRKLRQFQEAGHQVVLIVADWTARIGDPSGVSTTRPVLSREQVLANAETYMNQFFKIVEREKTEVRWQSEWFDKFTLTDVIRLTNKFTLAPILAREDFAARLSAGRPITLTELLYALLQAYDSVAVKADVEFGGIDQKLNFLVGRELQAMDGQASQQCFMVPLLIGTDGKQKMSKSLDNRIGISEPPDTMFGKIMSIPDNLILQYLELLTDVPDAELNDIRQSVNSHTVNPMTVKKRLAREVIVQFYYTKDASEAEDNFMKTVQKKEIPSDIKEYRVSYSQLAKEISGEHGVNISRLLVVAGLAKSRSEASRLIKQGAVEIDGKRVTAAIARINSPATIQAGKRNFAKVVNTDKMDSEL